MNTVTLDLYRFKELEDKEIIADLVTEKDSLEIQIEEMKEALKNDKVKIIYKKCHIEPYHDYVIKDDIINKIVEERVNKEVNLKIEKIANSMNKANIRKMKSFIHNNNNNYNRKLEIFIKKLAY